jgi:tetratricopeptide (TPR) repeat protein
VSIPRISKRLRTAGPLCLVLLLSCPLPALAAGEPQGEPVPFGPQPEATPSPQKREPPPAPARDTEEASAEPSEGAKPAAEQGAEPATLPPAAANLPPAVTILATRDLRLGFRIAERGSAELVGAAIHYTLDGGQSWSSVEEKPDGPSILFHAPRDGRYGFALSVIDAVGARSPAPRPGDQPALEAIVDTTGPSIRVLRPERLEPVAADSRVEIEWETQDENPAPAPVEVSSSLDGGPWDPIWTDAPARGRRSWNVPLFPGEVRLRFRARDLAGNAAEVVTLPVYRIMPGPAPYRWVAVAPHSRSRRLNVYYRLTREGDPTGPALEPQELRKVQLWYRSEAIEWTAGDVDPDRRSPLEFQAPADGWYDLLVTGLDQKGRWLPSGAAPGPGGRPDHNLAPHARCLVDTLEPRLGIEDPLQGSWVEAGGPLSIRYWVEEENLRPRSVAIASSLDRGATWTKLAEGLEPEPVGDGRRARGEFHLKLPSIESEGFLLKVTALDVAGNSGEALTDLERPITIRNPREDPGRKADENYRRGVLQLRSSDPSERRRALLSFRRALIYRPDHAAAHHDLAVALEAMGGAEGAAGGDDSDEPLTHYRLASSAAPEDPRFAFSLVGALMKRAEAGSELADQLKEEAEAVFGRISWTRLVELEDREESQRLRRQYRAWKSLYFNRAQR